MPKIGTKNYYKGVGRRKTAVAQIRLTPGKGEFVINGTTYDLPAKISAILDQAGKLGQFDISAIVRGGGMVGQIDAIALGVARALTDFNNEFRPALRKAGWLTRDPRAKERKKPGLKRARRASQWAKR